ncbi:MAG: HGxxPAAW family protein [Motilibacteraceae bacterium]
MVENSPRGRASSWGIAAFIFIGFLVGALGLVLGPTWWLFFVGVGVVLVGVLAGWATGMMEDVH